MAALTGFTDGLANFGSMVLSIGEFTAGTPPTISSGVSYVADNVTINRESHKITQTNQINKITGKRFVVGDVTGTAEVQLAATSTLCPLLFEAFTLTIYDDDNSGATNAEWFVISGVSQPYVKDGETKVNITFDKIYNLTTAASTAT